MLPSNPKPTSIPKPASNTCRVVPSISDAAPTFSVDKEVLELYERLRKIGKVDGRLLDEFGKVYVFCLLLN
jgi:hypothetical protein